jgi:hypothetical protein
MAVFAAGLVAVRVGIPAMMPRATDFGESAPKGTRACRLETPA